MIYRLNRLLLCAIFTGWSSGLFAGQLTVSPLTMNMTATQPNAIYKLDNGSDMETFYQLQLFAWEVIEGKTQLRRQNDLVVTPPVTLIPGNTEQTIRIIRQQETESDKEKSYRLIISELPDTEKPQGANVRVLLRMSLPVFVGGEDKEPQLTAYFKDGTLRIRNSGSRHAKISDAFWFSADKDTPHPIQKGLMGYALPDSEFHIPANKTPPIGAIKFFSATINGQSQTILVEG
ncbi:fimbria/pilus periplasmic chaperone [Alcanivorax sp. S6407]|uniref:fimbrial biogenesis chaperone n=1 Tax=Alcanivorax sp. S6407 TaxID=2926424 RepID=UPI001FF3A403|nr:fimbria/pilus periplasmic chaperone [Alcanivorax sp. S6407]MCK0155160.1 fimbria/pilus periplasmic chaperone [Alcanivorax sp. S6407]